MKATLIDLFTSKKFLTALAAVIIYVAGRFGFNVDPAALDRIFAALLAYVGAQGLADIGKSAAAINAVAKASEDASPNAGMNSPTPSANEAMKRVASTVSMLLVVALGFGVLSATACGPQAKALEAGLWNCLAPERAQAVEVLTPLAESAILAAASADGKLIDTSKLRAAVSKASLTTEAGVLLECAMASAVTALLTPTSASSGASALVLDPAALRDAWSKVAPRGARFHTAGGDL